MKARLILYLAIFLAAFFLQSSFACISDANSIPGKATPRIDEKAAYTEKAPQESVVKETASTTGPYSQNFWIFILGAYMFLMVFNLSSDFGKTKYIQWFWVSVFTFLAIFSWDNLDVSRANTWFPKAAMEIGIMLYLFYLYFFFTKTAIITEQKRD